MKNVLRYLVIGFCLASLSLRAAEPVLRISAAISLKDAFEAIDTAYESETGAKVELNVGASGQLMAQIREGAPVDLFVSAAQKQVDDLVDSDLADDSTRKVVAKNSLVLIVPADQKDGVKSFADLSQPSVKKIAIGQPRTVPAGEYAMQVLKALKIDGAVEGRLVSGANVRQVLDYVARDEVDAGIVYKTDALQAAKEVRIVETAREEDHKPIEYPAVIIKGSAHADEAKKFLAFLAKPNARKLLADRGFALPSETVSRLPAKSSTSATAP